MNITNADRYSTRHPWIGSALLLMILAATMHCTDATEYATSQYRNAADLHFQVAASYGNFDETVTGSLAATNGADSSARLFGQTMVSEHSAMESELQKIVDSVHAVIPQTPDPAHQTFLTQLQHLSGKAFDSAWLQGQVTDEDSSIALYQSEVANGSYVSLVSYARKYLVQLQTDRMVADSLLRVAGHP